MSDAQDPSAAAQTPSILFPSPPPVDPVAWRKVGDGLRVAGLGYLAISIAVPLLAGSFPVESAGQWIANWSLVAVGLVLFVLGITTMARRSTGPLDGVLARLYVGVCGAGWLSALFHVVSASRRAFANDHSPEIANVVDLCVGAAVLAMPWMMWAYCRDRGPTRHAREWLGLGIAALALVLLNFPFHPAFWVWFPFLGFFALLAALRTASSMGAQLESAPRDEAEAVSPLVALDETRTSVRLHGVAMLLLGCASPWMIWGPAGLWPQVVGSAFWLMGMLVPWRGAVPEAKSTEWGPVASRRGALTLTLVLVAIPLLYIFSRATKETNAETMWNPQEAARFTTMLLGMRAFEVSRICRNAHLQAYKVAWWIVLGVCVAVYLFHDQPEVFWCLPVVGVIAVCFAQRTARNLWLDAVARHARLFSDVNPALVVEPLHPADRH